MRDLPAIGIDVGGGSTKIGIVAPDGRILARTKVASDPAQTAGDLVDLFLDAGLQLLKNLGLSDFAGTGVGLPGQIDHDRGATEVCNVTSLNGFRIVDHVGIRTGRACVIENDATMAAIAEHRFGVGQGASRFMTVTLGTGIGVGFIADGRPVHSSKGTMGDIGHVIVDPSGSCSCRQGCRGCLESVASGVALADRYKALRGEREDPASESEPDLVPLFSAAKAGDPDCRAILEDAARYIGAGIVSWLHIFAPDRLAFAGGVSSAGPLFLDAIEATIRRLAMADYLTGLTMMPAEMGNDAGFVGAASLAISRGVPQ